MRPARPLLLSLAVLVMAALFVVAQEPVQDAKAKFEATFRKMSVEKAAIMRDARQHLAERYDLTDRPAAGVTMTRGKAVQDGVRVKLPAGITWQQAAAMTPDCAADRSLAVDARPHLLESRAGERRPHRENVVRHDSQRISVAELAAEREEQRRLSAADWTADAD